MTTSSSSLDFDVEMEKRQRVGSKGINEQGVRRLKKQIKKGNKRPRGVKKLPPECRCQSCHKALEETEGTRIGGEDNGNRRICENCYNRGMGGLYSGKM